MNVSHTLEPGLIPGTPTTSNFRLVKKNKRLMIVDSEDNLVYYPPDFLRPVTNRNDFLPLLEDANSNGFLSGKAIGDFEAKFNPRMKK